MSMDFMRRSPDAKPNDDIVDTGDDAAGKKSNLEWLRAQKIRSGVLLLGGVTIEHFRVRVAQSRYRDDLAPSFWSAAGILLPNEDVLTVPIDRVPSVGDVPAANGVHRFGMKVFDSAAEFPNIAVLSFTDDLAPVEQAVERIKHTRAVLDLPSMLVTWLGYVWATDAASNPLRDGIGLPSAAFVETAFASCSVEISPGQRTASSSPEAIWQAARWWSGFYAVAKKHDKKVRAPTGVYRVKQWAAAALGARDNLEGSIIKPADAKPADAGPPRGRAKRKR